MIRNHLFRNLSFRDELMCSIKQNLRAFFSLTNIRKTTDNSTALIAPLELFEQSVNFKIYARSAFSKFK